MTFFFYRYWAGVVRTIEKRFDFRSSQTALLASIGDILQCALVLLIGYIGPRIHKPRYVSLSMMITGIGTLVMALPYAVYGPKISEPLSQQPTGGAGINTGSRSNLLRMCYASDLNSNESCSSTVNNFVDSVIESEGAYSMFVIGMLLVGLGGVGFRAMAVTYIDENVNLQQTAVYLGKTYMI